MRIYFEFYFTLLLTYSAIGHVQTTTYRINYDFTEKQTVQPNGN